MDFGLTDRELEVIIAVAEQGTRQSAADALGLSVDTIRNHMSAVLRKTETHSALQAYHRLMGIGKMQRVITTTVEYREEAP